MNKINHSELRNIMFKSIHDYLTNTGWKLNENCLGNEILYMIDPITDLKHRSDFALIIQTERELNELNKS